VQRTRRSILEYLKEHGRASLEELAQCAGVVPMSARGHLNVLERDGLISYEEERGKVGRPRFVYSLTDRGHDHFPKSYHTLCNRLLDTVTTDSQNASCELASRLAERWAADYVERLCDLSFDEQVRTLTQIRTDEGAMATCEAVADGYVIHQRNCPASCVASRFPQIICAAEIGFMRRLINAPVERLTWAVNGDATCSYRICRPRPEASVPGPESEQPPACRPAPAD
jgi:predicted ArsR family transcriptional regulator